MLISKDNEALESWAIAGQKQHSSKSTSPANFVEIPIP
jgi:hypothetical protein